MLLAVRAGTVQDVSIRFQPIYRPLEHNIISTKEQERQLPRAFMTSVQTCPGLRTRTLWPYTNLGISDGVGRHVHCTPLICVVGVRSALTRPSAFQLSPWSY